MPRWLQLRTLVAEAAMDRRGARPTPAMSASAELKVMPAIENCRTAAFGGHVARCENDKCGHTQIAYNSCLMGKFSNGELAYRHRQFFSELSRSLSP
jgi:Transposase zinc-binding domain